MNRESEKGTDIKDKIEEKSKKASEFVEKAEDKINDQLEKYSKTISSYIKNCPIRSVLTAGAVGLLFGLLIKNG